MNNVINADEFVHCAIFSILFQYCMLSFVERTTWTV